LYPKTRDVRLQTWALVTLLAAEKGLSAPAIEAIVRENEETVRRWMQGYMA
jgi:hypothetical protein